GIQVFPGDYGYTREGHVVTFPRGGSDITGAILAAAVGATIYENFTDVDGVFAADPAIVWDAVPIAEMTYREMRELSYSGFSVLHDEAIIPAVRAGIPICIKNTNRPELPGTMIVPEHRHATPRVVGIASSAGFCTVFVGKYLMNREVGFGRRLLQIFEEEGISFEHTPSGIDNMSVIVREQQFGPEVEQRVGEVIRTRMAVDALRVERGLALIMVVGEGMRYQVGIAARATRALADASVNIEMMNQGSSEISMMFGVKAEEREKAVRALYDAFFRHKGKDAAEQQA
ncbi:MAG: ACT domain-containing protein, partial [Kiritimatiellia bacterium]